MVKILLFLLVLVAVFLLGRDLVVNRLNLIFSDYLIRNLPFVIFLVLISMECPLSSTDITLPGLSSYILMLDGLMLMMPSSYAKQHGAYLFPALLSLCFLLFVAADHLVPSLHLNYAFLTLSVPLLITAFYYCRMRGFFSSEYSFFVDCSHVILSLSAMEVITLFLPLKAGSCLSSVISLLLILIYANIYLVRSRGRRASLSMSRKPVPKSEPATAPPTAQGRGEFKDEQYRMELLFSRVERYMKEKEPYLDEHLTLADMASALYTNKASLSKAINHISGKNYCQYVNKYRVDYAVSLMMKDKRLKVIEIAMMSGFHSLASFNMAFRLFRGDTPSEFMRTAHLSNLP